MTPGTPIAEKALAFGKVLEFSVSPLGFHIPVSGARMFVLASLALASNSPQKRAKCGSNQLGQPQSRQHFESSNDGAITFCEANSSGLALGAHVSLQAAFDFSKAEVYRTDSPKLSPCELGAFSDAQALENVALPHKPSPFAFEWLISPKTKITLHERIMARLLQAEAHEHNQSLKQDYRQAFVCVSFASRGNTEPFLSSSYSCYGTHPDKVWPKIMANRAARLGKEFPQWYDAAGNLRPDLPKKPQVSSPTQEAAERFTSERLAALIQFTPKKETA